jgi:multiple sugar transport system ATP-binding protein
VTHDQVEAMTMGDRIMVINDGLLMQIDSPRRLYDRPNNLFVAGFIGSPSMNFFESTLISEENNMIVDTGDFRIHVPEDRIAAFTDYIGKKILLGIRPENIHGLPYVPPDINSAPLTAKVEVVELLGHELHMFMSSGQNSFVSIVDTRLAPAIGDDLDLVVDVDRLHLFDRDTEQAIR